MNNFFTLLTEQGKARFAAAYAEGKLLKLTHMAVGDGHLEYKVEIEQENTNEIEDSQNNKLATLVNEQVQAFEKYTSLKHEVWRGPLNKLSLDETNPHHILAEAMIDDTVGGFTIREVGLFDEEGVLIALGKIPESYKPVLAEGSNKQFYICMVLEVSNVQNVALMVDPNVVMATRAHVSQRITEELAKLDFKKENIEATLPLDSLPKAAILTEDGRLRLTSVEHDPSSKRERQGGKVLVPAGVKIFLGKETSAGLGCMRVLTTSEWLSPALPIGEECYLRAYVQEEVLNFYMQIGQLNDPIPQARKGHPSAKAGGGFPSTSIDICIARLQTDLHGLPLIQHVINKSSLVWSHVLNGSGVVYLPVDPHMRYAKINVSNPSSHLEKAATLVHGSDGWMSADVNYGASDIAKKIIDHKNTIYTSTAYFDHQSCSSLWWESKLVLPRSREMGAQSLASITYKALREEDYKNGLAIHYANCLNVPLSWEIKR